MEAVVYCYVHKLLCCAVLWLLQGMKHADFIVEAVVEDEGVKKSIFQQLDKVNAVRKRTPHHECAVLTCRGGAMPGTG